MASRVFAVLAAFFLVAAVATAALTPMGMTLGQALLSLDRTAVEWLRGHSTGWAWSWVELPFLLRPRWLLPACMGVVCAGLAMSFNRESRSTSRRRRS